MAGKAGMKGTKRKTLPKTLRPGWLKKGDARTAAYRTVHASLAELVEQYGGAETLTPVERRLLERFIHVELLALRFEKDLRSGNAIDVGSYLASVDRMHGLAKTLGIKRVAKRLPTLQEYIGSEAPTNGR